MPDSSTLDSAIPYHSALEETVYSWLSPMPKIIPLHGPVNHLPCADPTICWSFVHPFPRTEYLWSTHRRKMALAVHILPIFNLSWVSSAEAAQKGAKGRAHHGHGQSQPSPGGKLCILLRVCRWHSSKESPVCDEPEQQQVLLPVLLPARSKQTVFTLPATWVNPQSLMRTDPMFLRSLLAQALIYILNSCLRRPNLLRCWCFFSCLFW